MNKKSSMGIGKPSKRQAEILHFAREYRRENGYSPALTEIAKHFDISIPTVHEHISHLQEKKVKNDQFKRYAIISHPLYKYHLWVSLPRVVQLRQLEIQSR